MRGAHTSTISIMLRIICIHTELHSRETNKSNCGREHINGRQTEFRWSVNASLGYLAVTPPALGNHGNRVNVQQQNYIILWWESRQWEREMEGEWGMGERMQEEAVVWCRCSNTKQPFISAVQVRRGCPLPASDGFSTCRANSLSHPGWIIHLSYHSKWSPSSPVHAWIETYVSFHAIPPQPVENGASFRELNHFMLQLCVTCLIQIAIYPLMREEQPHWTWRDLSSSQTLFIWWIHLLERFGRFRTVASHGIIIFIIIITSFCLPVV